MIKFGRTYILTIESSVPGEPDIVITDPITLEFDIIKDTYSSGNTAELRLYNLDRLTQNQIRKDYFDNNLLRTVELSAGYFTSTAVIFRGNITMAHSVREGVNFITSISAIDAGFAFANGNTSRQFVLGTPQEQIMRTILAKDLPDVTLGAVGSFPGNISRGNSYSGNSCEILRELSGGAFFVDNGVGHILGTNEYITGTLIKVDASTGLLGTPVRNDTIIHFDMVFEPNFYLGGLAYLNSATLAAQTGPQSVAYAANPGQNFVGYFKVIAISHRGTISGAVCGDAITTVGLQFGPGIFPNEGITPGGSVLP